MGPTTPGLLVAGCVEGVPYARLPADEEAIIAFWIFHSGGDLMPLMDDLLTLGMDGLRAIEPGATGPGEVTETISGQIHFAGTVDVQTLLPWSDPGLASHASQVAEEIKRRLISSTAREAA